MQCSSRFAYLHYILKWLCLKTASTSTLQFCSQTIYCLSFAFYTSHLGHRTDVSYYNKNSVITPFFHILFAQLYIQMPFRKVTNWKLQSIMWSWFQNQMQFMISDSNLNPEFTSKIIANSWAMGQIQNQIQFCKTVHLFWFRSSISNSLISDFILELISAQLYL